MSNVQQKRCSCREKKKTKDAVDHFGDSVMQMTIMEIRQDYLLDRKHTLTRHEAALNHAPPSKTLRPSNWDSEIRFHLKKAESQDFLMQTSPEISHPKLML